MVNTGIRSSTRLLLETHFPWTRILRAFLFSSLPHGCTEKVAFFLSTRYELIKHDFFRLSKKGFLPKDRFPS